MGETSSLFNLAESIKVTSEIQVRELFFKYAKKLGFKIVESRKRFPDYVLQGRSGILYNAEVEFDLANFVRHQHDWRQVDFVICWNDTLEEIPQEYAQKTHGEVWIPFFNLKEELEKLGVVVVS